MGQDVSGDNKGPGSTRAFAKALLRDLRALEEMIRSGMIGPDVARIGAEQEMFLVDEDWRPAPVADRVLEGLDGPFANELALFNLEANVEPIRLGRDSFSRLHARLDELVDQVHRAAGRVGSDVVLTGILPTLCRSDASLANITPKPRYQALDRAVADLRGNRPYGLRIEGADELHLQVESVMLESCTTSFQVHLQVDPAEFAGLYNVAQLVTAPLMAAAVNSPLLFGKRLWHETRIALFQQSVDTRSGLLHMRDLAPRVRFGDGWVSHSVVELFAEDIARFRVLLTRPVGEDPFAVLAEGGAPALQALQLHNSTVYRWNRPCYGVTEGKPHIRIECRVLPAGPSVVDEVANAAFWVGMVLGGRDRLGDVPARIDFAAVKANFLAAARHGLEAGFRWLDGRAVSARNLILEEALPLARAGLEGAGVDATEAERYLNVVEQRVRGEATGAQWLLESLRSMKERGSKAEWLSALTAATVARQRVGDPGSTWPLARMEEIGDGRLSYARVEQFMTTSLFTVNEEELVDMVAFLMDRQQIRHVLVENAAHELVGLVSYRSVLRLLAEGFQGSTDAALPVKAIMERDPPTVNPETPTLEAIDLMQRQKVTCLPVVNKGKLVGIVSERDFLPIAYELLNDRATKE